MVWIAVRIVYFAAFYFVILLDLLWVLILEQKSFILIVAVKTWIFRLILFGYVRQVTIHAEANQKKLVVFFDSIYFDGVVFKKYVIL